MVTAILTHAIPSAPAAQDVVTTQTVWQFLEAGGPVMWPLGLCSIVALAYAMERFLALRKERILPRRLDATIAQIERGELDGAREVLERERSPAGRILLAGVRRRWFSLHDMERAMEDQAHKEYDRLRGSIRTLNLIAAVAPLLGLLGTVLGIRDAFHRVVLTGMGKPEHLAAGIEEALITTIVGLSLAIPVMLLAAHLLQRARRLLAAVDERLTPAVDALALHSAQGRAAVGSEPAAAAAGAGQGTVAQAG